MTAAARLRSRVRAVGERRFGGWCVRVPRTRCPRTHLRPSVSTRCFLQLERRTALRTNCCSELASHRSRKLAVRAAYDAFHDDSDATAQSERATIVHGRRGLRLCDEFSCEFAVLAASEPRQNISKRAQNTEGTFALKTTERNVRSATTICALSCTNMHRFHL